MKRENSLFKRLSFHVNELFRFPAEKLSHRKPLFFFRPGSAVGGHDMFAVSDRLREGCHILSATTGRLKDMVDKGRVSRSVIEHSRITSSSVQISLQKVKYFVLDEADR